MIMITMITQLYTLKTNSATVECKAKMAAPTHVHWTSGVPHGRVHWRTWVWKKILTWSRHFRLDETKTLISTLQFDEIITPKYSRHNSLITLITRNALVERSVKIWRYQICSIWLSKYLTNTWKFTQFENRKIFQKFWPL